MSLLTEVIEHSRFALRESEYLRWYPKTLLPIDGEPEWKSTSLRGAYIHVPFCDKICKFCPFNKVLSDSAVITRYVNALRQEIRMLSERIGGGPLSFIYFGGGTPSVLDPTQISSILEELDIRWGLRDDVEVTLETHPTHANRHYLDAVTSAGVNRISIGIQSFRQPLLSALGATHGQQDSRDALENACSVLNNVAIDLLYRYHPQTAKDWHEDLRTAIEDYKIPHLSCYALVPNGSINDQPSEEDEVNLAIDALAFGKANGLYHYASCASGGFDIARPDRVCRYELEHWGAPQSNFVGLGPGAFGFAGGHSTVNRLGVSPYCSALEDGSLPLASAVPVDETELRHRYFVLGIKALNVPFATYRNQFGREPLGDFANEIKMLKEEELATVDAESLTLSPLGRLYVDSCSTIFFSESQRNVPHPEEPEIRALERLYKA